MLFQLCCATSSMYCCSPRFNFTSSSIKKLKTKYNSALRNLLLIKKPYSANTMFVTHGILFLTNYFALTFIGFLYRVSKNSNFIIMACITPIVYIHSPIWQLWRLVLYSFALFYFVIFHY